MLEHLAFSRLQHLNIRTAGVRGAAEKEDAFVLILEVRLYGIKAHVGGKRDRVRPVHFERFDRVSPGS